MPDTAMWVLVPLVALLVAPRCGAQDCGGTYELAAEETLVLSSPVDEEGQYPRGLNCQYLITSQAPDVSFIISCSPDEFDVRMTRKCRAGDRLIINDNQTLTDSYCGSKVPNMLMTGGPYLSMRFRTNRDQYSGRGFNLTIKAVSFSNFDQQLLRSDEAFVPPRGYDCTCGQRRSARISGGSDTSRGDHPWQGAVMIRGEVIPKCSAVTIDDRHVLTAAGCVAEEDLQVHFGEHDFTEVDRVIIRDVTSYVVNGDLAVLTLSYPLNLGSTHPIQPICLPDGNTNFDSSPALTSGWGAAVPGGLWSVVLQEVAVTVDSSSSCANSSFLCAAPVSSGTKMCPRDSGSPLVVEVNGQYVLVGIAATRRDCFGSLVFNDIQKQLSWIEQVTSDGVSCRTDDGLPDLPCVSGTPRNASAEPVHINNYPWTVALMNKQTNTVICSGAILSTGTVLTSSFCTGNISISDLEVRLNAQDLTNRKVTRFINRNVANVAVNTPLALLTLEPYVSITGWDGIVPAMLPAAGLTIFSTAIHTGYGGGGQVLKSTSGAWEQCPGTNLCFRPSQTAGFCDTDLGGPIVSPLTTDPSRYVLVGVAVNDRGCDNVRQRAAAVVRNVNWITASTPADARVCRE